MLLNSDRASNTGIVGFLVKCEANRSVTGLLDSVYFDEFDMTTLKYLNFELIAFHQ
jgi:hypothetical protein